MVRSCPTGPHFTGTRLRATFFRVVCQRRRGLKRLSVSVNATMSMPLKGQSRSQGDSDLRSLYQEHRWDLVRLASLLLNDPADAEEVVQDAFVKAYLAWGRLREQDKALSYLRSIVLNGARSRMRHLRVVSGFRHPRPGVGESAESAAVARDEQRRMIAALRSLPDRQRECLA